MSRLWLRLVLVALLTLVMAVGAALAVYAVTLPYFVAAVLTRVTGRAVELESVELRPTDALVVRVRGLRVYERATPDGPLLVEIPELQGRHAWARVFAGELVPRRWTLRGGYFQLRMGWGDEAGARTPAELLSFPALDLSVREARVDLLFPGEDRVRLDDISLELERAERPLRLRGSAHASLESADAPAGEVFADLDVGGADASGELRLVGVDLTRLPRGGLPARAGAVSGTLALTRESSTLRVAYDLEIAGFQLRPESFSAALEPARTALRGNAALERDGMRLELLALELDDLVVRGEVELGGESRRLRGGLRLDGFELGPGTRDRVNAISLLGLRFATFARLNERAEAGSIVDGTIDFDLPFGELEQALSFRRKLRPEELRVAARVRDAVFRPSPGSVPLRDLQGSIEIAGNVLSVRDARMRRGGSALPKIDLEVDGMHRLAHLPPAERQTPRGPGVPIPGLGPATRALRGARPPEEGTLVFELEDARVAHPAFLLEIRDAQGKLHFPEGALAVDLRGVLGGAPARIGGIWDPDARTVEARVFYEDGEARAPPARPPRGWVSATARTRELPIGPWRLEGVEGRLLADGPFVELTDVTAQVAGGALRAQGTVSIAEPETAPYGLTTQLVAARGRALGGPLGIGERTLRGTAQFQGSWTGRLRPGHPFLTDAHLGGSFEVRDGELARLPATVVLARLPSLQGVRGLFGQPLPFDRMSAQFTLDRGTLRTQDFALEGPELRMLAAGEIDVLRNTHETDMVVAMLFLETIDRVLGQVPFVGRWVLGDDRNLIALYVRLEGPWRSPRASLVAPSAVQTAAGWAGSIINEGARRLRGIFAGEVDGRQGTP